MPATRLWKRCNACTVLDSSAGRPAPDVHIALQRHVPSAGNGASFQTLASGVTNADGRCLDLLPPNTAHTQQLKPGLYKVVFKVKEYFERKGQQCFYPWVEITFDLVNVDEHYHIPLLISPYSFTTYRGS